jgi:hypothetical protein
MDDRLDWEPYDRHWIRLRGPWDVAWITPREDAHDRGPSSFQRVRLPADWKEIFGNRTGTARFVRRFQCPTNLDRDERVLITLCDVQCTVSARLNDVGLIPLAEPIGEEASSPCEDSLSFDITELLQPANRVSLELTVDHTQIGPEPCGLWRPVLLEVVTLE